MMGFAVADVFLLALAAYDFFRRGKLHPATLIGSGDPDRLQSPDGCMVGQTQWWQHFANSLV